MRVKIRLDTTEEVFNFVKIAEMINEEILIKDGNGKCVSGKSILGMLYALEFDHLWCECEKDIYFKIQKYVIEE